MYFKIVIPVFTCVIVSCSSFWVLSCGKKSSDVNAKPVDIVTITDINTYITPSDTAEGIRKTANHMAPVRMSHAIHDKAGIACEICHHTHDNSEGKYQCAWCHKGAQADPIIHNLCITCHVAGKKGPTVCLECHKTGPVR